MASVGPRVEPVDRRGHIAVAATFCFMRSGFHGASMQATCIQAGMSARALYRYFPSKAAIIVAIAEAERQRHALFFQRLDQADDPLAALKQIAREILGFHLSGAGQLLTADVIAEAARNPEMRAAFQNNAILAQDSIAQALVKG